jgi:hypothetical protein
MERLAGWMIAVVLAAAAPGGLRGRVVDAQTGEPLARVLVRVQEPRRETTTDAEGRFEIDGLVPGPLRLHVGAVGYGFEERALTLLPGEPLTVEVALPPEALRRSESVVVTAGAFQPVESPTSSEYTLSPGELKNLGGVVIDDPLRSVQALPGVATGDDFYASFAARGADYSRTGFYLDGILLDAPFHTIRNIDSGGLSISILSADLVESLSLMTGGAPPRYGDRIGSVLAVRTREGGDHFGGRANLSLIGGLSASLEGPLGGPRLHGLLAARKSYLGYVLSHLSRGSTVLGFYDLQGKLSFEPSPSQRLSLLALQGDFNWDEHRDEGAYDDNRARARTSLASVEWRWLLGAKGSLETSLFASQETGRNFNHQGQVLLDQDSRQVGLRTDLIRALSAAHRLEAGLLLRGLGERRLDRSRRDIPPALVASARYDRGTSQPGAYAQDTWSLAGGRLALSAGARADRLGATGQTVWLPRTSLRLRLGADTTLAAGAGAYAQFPTPAQLWGLDGAPDLRAERMRELGVAIERRLGERTRLRVEVYQHDAREALFDTAREPRLANGRILPGDPASPLANALGGRSRGVELLLQRRSANGLSGWISYALGHARLEDAAGASAFDSDFDQRHTLNVYAAWRLGGDLSLSTKYRYGSGFPLAGFFRPSPVSAAFPEGLALGAARNQVRQDGYSRWDVRANKAFHFDRWKLTLYAELVNVLDRDNERIDAADVDLRTGAVFLAREKLFPILPAVGLSLEF